jgi:hypothetical protein
MKFHLHIGDNQYPIRLAEPGQLPGVTRPKVFDVISILPATFAQSALPAGNALQNSRDDRPVCELGRSEKKNKAVISWVPSPNEEFK